MNIKDHCKECLRRLGRDWKEVHLWLDEFAKDFPDWMGHRQIRHHDEGVEEVRAIWGDEAADAARIHIIQDEGAIPTRQEIEKRYGKLVKSGIVEVIVEL